MKRCSRKYQCLIRENLTRVEAPNDSDRSVFSFLSFRLLQENFFDIQEALQAIHMRQEMLREQLACAKSKGEETVGRNLQVGQKNRRSMKQL